MKKIVFIFILIFINIISVKADTLFDGFKEIDENMYYFQNGEPFKGLLEIDDSIYMFSRSTGKMMYGWFDYDWDGKNDYYFDKSTGIALTGKREIDGNKYLFHEDGKLHRDIYVDDNKIYMYDKNTGKMMYGWFDYDLDGKNDYYFDKSTGIALTGKREIDGNKYLFHEDGKLHRDIYVDDNKIYMYDKNIGKMMYGWFDYDLDGKNDYYFDKSTGIALTGKREIDGNKYLFHEDGKLHKDIYVDDNNDVYMYSRSTGKMMYGWFDYDWNGKNDYYFDKSTGIAVIGKREIDGNKYLFHEDGKLHKDIYVDDNNDVYMYSRSTGKMMYGWFDYDWNGKNDYYFDKSTGIAVIGKREIDGNKYLFHEDGKLHRDIYVDENNDVYMYSRSTGKMMYGWFDYDWNGKNDYYFDKSTGIAVIGKREIDGNKYLFHEDGKLHKDIYVDDNNDVYMYSRSTGKMMYGWFDYDWNGKNDYYFDKSTGVALKDLKEINNNKYMFSRSTGKMMYGWFDYDWDGKNDYYFDDITGIMVTGMRIIGGVPHYFRSDGLFVSKEFSLYIDVSKYQKNIDWDRVKKTNVYGAILRLGYGTSYLDPCVEDEYFSSYYQESVRTGLFQGIYFYSYALNSFSAQAEANFVIERLKQYKVPKNTHIYYDLEENPWTKILNKSDYDIIIKKFFERLKQEGYNNISVYTYKFWAENRLSVWAQSTVEWIAQYSDRCTYKGSNYRGWQFTSSGRVDGISTEVDMSYFK